MLSEFKTELQRLSGGAPSAKLAPNDVTYLEELYVPHRIVGHQELKIAKGVWTFYHRYNLMP
jgi:hypothetical protein